jgi:hypothetical protein
MLIDKLIVCNTHNTNIKNTLAEFNSIYIQIKFTNEKDIQNKLNYLDVTITNLHDRLMFNIFI